MDPKFQSDYLCEMARGNHRVFYVLYTCYEPELYKYLVRMVGRHTAQDIVQDVFVKVWQMRTRMVQVQSVRAYLFHLARNEAYDFLRRRATRQRSRERLQRRLQLIYSAEEYYLAHDLMTFITSTVGKMPAQRLCIFRLSRQKGMPRDEIARLLNLSPETVANHLHIALMQLRDALRDTPE